MKRLTWFYLNVSTIHVQTKNLHVAGTYVTAQVITPHYNGFSNKKEHLRAFQVLKYIADVTFPFTSADFATPASFLSFALQ